jgi:glycosyltransferase involved in cell wall biosynthesis
MSVAHLLGSADDGGAEKYFIDLIGALHGGGIVQGAALRAHAGRERALAALGVQTRVLPFGAALDFSTKRGVAALARELGAKVLVAWMSRAGAHAPTGPWTRIGRLGGYYDPKYFRGFDMMVANTREIVDWAVGQGWSREQCLYIPNFAVPGAGEPLDRAALDTPANAPLLLGMGRLHSDKAHDISLRALTQLPDAFLWIAGSGPLEAELKALARNLGVAERVRFLGWRDDASSLYRTADICVFPSRIEPLGNVVLQAWAHGVPVIAGASKGPAALVKDGEDGLLIPLEDPDALASGVRGLLADASLGARLIAGGETRLTREFSPGAVVEQWRELFARFGAA